MPDILRLQTQDWELNVWVKDSNDRLSVLKKTMQSRGADVPPSAIYFSPALLIQEFKSSLDECQVAQMVSERVLVEPLFFENKQYEFEFIFAEGLSFSMSPQCTHRLASIEDAFHYSAKSRSLRGSINFGNDIGWFRLGLRYGSPDIAGGKLQEQTFSFEIVPTKMAMASDMARIHKEIDAEYPLWQFSFAQRTEQEMARSNKRHEHFTLLWLAHFTRLRKDLEHAVQVVMQAPHARLVPNPRRVKLHQLRGRLSPRLEECVHSHIKASEFHHSYATQKRHLSIDTPENRFVKMALQRCCEELTAIIKHARENQKVPEEGGRLSPHFFGQLDSWKRPLERVLNQSFFVEVGDYEGMDKESLVLHQRAGYANVYRIWQELKMYLGLFGQQASVSMKSVADLYEVWCFLEVKRMLMNLGFTLQDTKRASLTSNGLEKNMVNGAGSAFHLYRASDKVHITLAHEPKYGKSEHKVEGKIYSWVTEQKPDILLEARFDNKATIRWIFDAKYRIEDDKGVDQAPADAINQMHRYRDALIHIDKMGEQWQEKSRPILGAYVLYPGWFDETKDTQLYLDSIQDVGIGAFPLLPGRPNLWLKKFLQQQFGELVVYDEYAAPLADKYFVEDSARIAMTGNYLRRYHDLAMVAFVGGAKGRDPDYMQRFVDGCAGWYHLPVSPHPQRSISYNVMQETKFCSLAVYHKDEKKKVLKFIYEVESVTIVKRSELTKEQAGSLKESSEPYWLLKLGRAVELPNHVTIAARKKFIVFHTSANDLRASKQWSDLPQRYVDLVQKTELDSTINL